LFPSILKVLTIIRPETLVRWASGRLSLLLALEVAALSDSYSLGWADCWLPAIDRAEQRWKPSVISLQQILLTKVVLHVECGPVCSVTFCATVFGEINTPVALNSRIRKWEDADVSDLFAPSMSPHFGKREFL
jgi:hypothetical protein